MSSLFRPMLAATIHDTSKLNYPLLASLKLDGVRAIVKNCVVYSRSMKPIRNKHVQQLFGKAELEGVDGELILGEPTSPTVFRDTSSSVSRIKGEPDVRLYVFDMTTNPERPYIERHNDIPTYPNVVRLDSEVINSEEELLRYEEFVLGLGYEGVMLRDKDGVYKQGRSTLNEQYLMKLKRFLDSEAMVLGFTELMHNENEAEVNELGYTKRSHKKEGMVASGLLGAFGVRDVSTNVEFDVASGLDEELRKEIWDNKDKYLGKLIKYKYFPTGGKEKPRLPVFLGFRDLDDL